MAETVTHEDEEKVHGRFPVEYNLRFALEAEDPAEKNYYIRNALQFLTIDAE